MADREYQPSCICAGADVEVHKKRDRTLRLTIKNSDVGDITGSKLWMSVKERIEQADIDAVITKKSLNNGGSDSQAKVIDGANRIVEFYILPADTVALHEGDYWWDAVIELPSGRRLQLVPPSRFTVVTPVTVTS